MGRCKRLGPLTASPSYATQLSGAIFHLILSSSELTIESGCHWWLVNHRYSSPSQLPLGLRNSHLELELLMTVASLFTDMAGSTPFLRSMCFPEVADLKWGSPILHFIYQFSEKLQSGCKSHTFHSIKQLFSDYQDPYDVRALPWWNELNYFNQFSVLILVLIPLLNSDC